MRLYVYTLAALPVVKLTERWLFSYQDNSITFFGSFEVRMLSGLSLGLSVICDVLIAAALSYYLHSKRTGFKRSIGAFLERVLMI